MEAEFKVKFEEAQKFEEQQQNESALKAYQFLVDLEVLPKDMNNEISKIKENSIYKLGGMLAKLGKSEEISDLLKRIRPFFDTIAKAKTTKIVRTLIDEIAKVSNSNQFLIGLCKESIEWAKESKRTFLKQRIEHKLYAMYLEENLYQEALTGILDLLREVKKLDDKPLLVEIQLLECKIQQALKNYPKAKAALTAARTNANAIYCPPLLQAQIDLESGNLHVQEKDYKTGYSYYLEGFEGFNGLDNLDETHPKTVLCLRYMILCKIMTNSITEVFNIVNGKSAIPFQQLKEIEALTKIAKAQKERSLHKFEEVVQTYKEEVADDLINTHLKELYDNLLQENLLRLIEPFSSVEIDHVAKLIDLNKDLVEKKLSQMILDKKIDGILDQGTGRLILFDHPPVDKTYDTTLKTIEHMSTVVDSLFTFAANKLN